MPPISVYGKITEITEENAESILGGGLPVVITDTSSKEFLILSQKKQELEARAKQASEENNSKKETPKAQEKEPTLGGHLFKNPKVYTIPNLEGHFNRELEKPYPTKEKLHIVDEKGNVGLLSDDFLSAKRAINCYDSYLKPLWDIKFAPGTTQVEDLQLDVLATGITVKKLAKVSKSESRLWKQEKGKLLFTMSGKIEYDLEEE